MLFVGGVVLVAFMLATLYHFYLPKPRPHPSYLVVIRGDEINGMIDAEMDGKNYRAVAALEDHLTTLPAQADLSCIIGVGGNMSFEQAALPVGERIKILKELNTFCSKRKIKLYASVVSD